jgi:inorganic pyrophosphatase
MGRNVNATHYEAIPTFPKEAKKHTVHAIIETAKNSPYKFALDNKYGIIGLNEVLPDDMRWPYDYGFIPGTLAPDGDPLDILVLSQHGLFSGCLVAARVLGAIRETKNGVENDRLIGALPPNRSAPQPSDDYKDIVDVPETLLKEIRAFLKLYSQRQGNLIKIKGTVRAKKAMSSVRKAIKDYKKNC